MQPISSATCTRDIPFSSRMSLKAFPVSTIGMMRDRNGNKVQMRTKEQVDSILKSNNAWVEDAKGYDAMFTLHMAISDFLGSSVPDEAHAALYVKDLLGDKDGYDGIVFTRFLADCSAKGIPVPWGELL